jgi:4-amino-4-deoxy-L-arabinose transferase-like glycosyltransferase
MTFSRPLFAALLCLAWIVPGLVAHDPWKPDEAHTFGVVYELLRGGSWIELRLAGEPFLDDPPLYHLSAAASAAAFSAWLPLHDAARLATGFWIALVLAFCGLTARELCGRGSSVPAVLLLLGSVGLAVRGHQMIADVAALAGFAAAYFGLALALRRRSWGGFWLGTGAGVVFLALGLFELLTVALIALAAGAACAAWRTRHYVVTLSAALVAALPWIAIWPLLLYARDPAQFARWLQADPASALLAGDGAALYYLGILPWYAWPLWPLALWALWRAGREAAARPEIALPLAGFIVTLFALAASPDAREIHALPLLLPLALLAAPALPALRRGAANAWYWFSVMGFTFFIAVAWFYWAGLELGAPARLHAHLHRIQPGYEPGFRGLPFALGCAYTLGWFAVLWALRRAPGRPPLPERPAVAWAAGITAIWGLLAILFIGWIDTGKSYRSMIVSMQKALPAHYRCIASQGLGEPQRAMLHYIAGIVTERAEVATRRRDCDLLLVQGRAGEDGAPAGRWRRIWEGARPGDKIERYGLYLRK